MLVLVFLLEMVKVAYKNSKIQLIKGKLLINAR